MQKSTDITQLYRNFWRTKYVESVELLAIVVDIVDFEGDVNFDIFGTHR